MSTSEYYKKNPDKARNRRIQQRRYNKHGSSKPGTKDITGGDITKRANQANRALGTYGNGDNKDAAHTGPNRARLQAEGVNRANPRKGKTYSSGKGQLINRRGRRTK